MRIFRKNRISDEQVKEILRSLPSVQAPTDFEDRVGRAIEAQRLEVPHILGSLPRVPAPDDFDAKLMRAIQERRRPTLTPVSGAVSQVGWLNSVAGWVGGALMIMSLAFFVDRSGVMSQDVAMPPAQVPLVIAQPTATQKTVPAPVAVPVVPPISIVPSGQPVSRMLPMRGVQDDLATPAVTMPKVEEIPDRMLKAEPLLQIEEQMQVGRPAHHPVPSVAEETERPAANTSVAGTPLHTGNGENATGTTEKIVPTDSVQGIVDTGGERDAADTKNP